MVTVGTSSNWGLLVLVTPAILYNGNQFCCIKILKLTAATTTRTDTLDDVVPGTLCFYKRQNEDGWNVFNLMSARSGLSWN